MTTRPASRWARAVLATAALVPITIATTVGAAFATEEPIEAPVVAPVVEIVEVVDPVEPAPAVEVAAAPAAAAAPAPEPEGLASTNDPQEPVESPPTTSATFPAPAGQTWNGWRSGPLEVTLSAIVTKPATIGEISWKLEGAQSESGSYNGLSTTVTISAEGVTTLTYFAVDSLDQVSEEKSIEFKIDSTAPTMQVVSPLASGVYYAGDSVLIDLDYGDPHLRTAYFRFLESGVTIITGNSVVLTEGVHPVRAYALDEAGNETIVDYSLTVLAGPDIVAPVVTVHQAEPTPASGWWNKAVNINFVATDASPIGKFEYRSKQLDGSWGQWYIGAAPTGASTLTTYFQFFASGEYAYQFRATDSLGNVSEPILYEHKTDKEVSAATISGFPVNFEVGDSYELYYSCADALSGVATCESSNGASGAMLPTDTAGTFTFTLTNTDKAGNSKTTTWEYTVGADATAPQVTVTSPATGWVSSNAVDVTFQATDDASGIARLWVQADGADPLSGRFVDGASYLFTVTAEGETTFTTYAVDEAGNQSAPQHYTVTIDRTAPTIDISKPANQVSSLVASSTFTKGQVVDLEFECADALSGVESCEAEGANGSTLPTATVGDHTVEFVAVDAAGNRTVRALDYTVVAAPVGGIPPTKPTAVLGLANTGLEIWPLVLLVAGLMAAGAGLLTASRARR